MRATRFGALAASAALASATILGGAGIASAQEAETDSITGGGATVEATATDNCELSFAFTDDTDDDLLEGTNWVVDYRVGDELPSIPKDEDNEDVEAGEDFDDTYSVFRPVVASNQDTVDGLHGLEDYDYDVGLLNHTVDLNDVVEENETGEHTVTFKFYRGSANWHEEENHGEVTVTGCDTDGGLIGSIVGSVDVFGSLGNMS